MTSSLQLEEERQTSWNYRNGKRVKKTRTTKEQREIMKYEKKHGLPHPSRFTPEFALQFCITVIFGRTISHLLNSRDK